jgi:heterodisulfide reductase subunit E
MAFYTLGLTFDLVILLTVIVLAVWIYGIYFNFKKWGLGSTGYHDQLRNSFWLFIATWIHEAFKEGVWVFLRTAVLDVLLLRRTLARSPVRWVMHMCMFYGFLTLAALSGLGLMIDIVEHFNLLGLAEQAEIAKGGDVSALIFGYSSHRLNSYAVSRRTPTCSSSRG